MLEGQQQLQQLSSGQVQRGWSERVHELPRRQVVLCRRVELRGELHGGLRLHGRHEDAVHSGQVRGRWQQRLQQLSGWQVLSCRCEWLHELRSRQVECRWLRQLHAELRRRLRVQRGRPQRVQQRLL